MGSAGRIPRRTQSCGTALCRARSRARGERDADDRQIRLDQPPDVRTACQLQTRSLFAARSVGLEIPRTVITNNPDEVRAFIAAAPAQVIYKASSPPRNFAPDKALFTGLITDETLANLDLIRITPGIFQERIDKSYELRITVIGARIFAVKSIPRRLPKPNSIGAMLNTMSLMNLSPCRAKSQRRSTPSWNLGLVYGAFDFIVTPDGRYVFLEVNPGGAYMWVEAATGLPITSALADALIECCDPG